MADQLEPRFWRIYTGQSDFKTDYQYRVNVTVRGTLTTKGQAWSGPWENAIGNGAIMINVPLPDDPGVTKRALTQREIFSEASVRAADGLDGEPGAPDRPLRALNSAPPPPGASPAPAPPVDVGPAGPGARPTHPRPAEPSAPRDRSARAKSAATGLTPILSKASSNPNPPRRRKARADSSRQAVSTLDPEGWVDVS